MAGVIVDSSAIVAIFGLEQDHEALIDKALAAARVFVAGPTVLESAMVISSRLDTDGFEETFRILGELRADVIPFDIELAEIAAQAFVKFGKGRHPASLNFGDCMVYALAKKENLPILCTGDEFSRTHIAVA